jgi:hypothetical protein
MLGTATLGAVLDVTIGLVVIYLLLAQVATGLQEAVSSVCAWRGSILAKGLNVLLSDDPNSAFQWSTHFWTTFFDFGLPPSKFQQRNGTRAEPQTPHDKIQDLMNHPLMRGNPSGAPASIPASRFSMALLDVLRDGSDSVIFHQAEETIEDLPEGDLKKTLSALLFAAGDDIDAFRKNLETWFEDSMNELSLLYKRMSHFVMLALGVLIAVSLNVDSIRIAHFLWITPAVAAQLVDEAGRQPKPAAQSPDSADNQKPPGQPPKNPSLGLDLTDSAYAKIRALPLPIGWTFAESNQPAPTNQPAATVNAPPAPKPAQTDTAKPLPWPQGWSLPGRLLGWFLTGFAISLGGPFWYDLMQNLLSVKGGGKKRNEDAAAA